MINIFKGDTMNPLELAAQKILIELLNNIKNNHDDIINLFTFGKLTDQKRDEIYQDILWTIKMIHPLFDIADKLIPDNTELQKIMDWCQTVYHNVIEPEIKK